MYTDEEALAEVRKWIAKMEREGTYGSLKITAQGGRIERIEIVKSYKTPSRKEPL